MEARGSPFFTSLPTFTSNSCTTVPASKLWALGPAFTSPLDSIPTVMVSRTAVYSRSRTVSSAGFPGIVREMLIAAATPRTTAAASFFLCFRTFTFTMCLLVFSSRTQYRSHTFKKPIMAGDRNKKALGISRRLFVPLTLLFSTICIPNGW